MAFAQFKLHCDSAENLLEAESVGHARLVVNGTKMSWENCSGCMDGTLAMTHEDQTCDRIFHLDLNWTSHPGRNPSHGEIQSLLCGSSQHPRQIPCFPFGTEVLSSKKSSQKESECDCLIRCPTWFGTKPALMVVVHKSPAQTGVLSDFLHHDTNQTNCVMCAAPLTALHHLLFVDASWNILGMPCGSLGF